MKHENMFLKAVVLHGKSKLKIQSSISSSDLYRCDNNGHSLPVVVKGEVASFEKFYAESVSWASYSEFFVKESHLSSAVKDLLQIV